LRRVVALLAAGWLTGCGADQLKVRAAREIECPKEKIDMEQIDDSRIRASGCGRTATYFCSMDSRGMDFCDREKPNPRKNVQDTAGFEFQCPPEKVKIDDVQGGFMASGCGKEGRYECRPTADAFRCGRAKKP
jgi:hypothetical protein